jgi:hypothetical protein
MKHDPIHLVRLELFSSTRFICKTFLVLGTLSVIWRVRLLFVLGRDYFSQLVQCQSTAVYSRLLHQLEVQLSLLASCSPVDSSQRS